MFSPVLALGLAVLTEGLDRDSLLTDAPATPPATTVRIAGVGRGGVGVESFGTTGRVNGTLLWVPIDRLALDAGAYFQSEIQSGGPTARVRYQILRQTQLGVDVAAGVRWKSVGFDPKQGEIELLVAAGRTVGPFDLTLNGVIGFETGVDGKDGEVKGAIAYRFGESGVRAGVESRLQIEIGKEAAEVERESRLSAEDLARERANEGREWDLVVGGTVSWLVSPELQVQGLVGIAAPRHGMHTSPLGMIGASFDF